MSCLDIGGCVNRRLHAGAEKPPNAIDELRAIVTTFYFVDLCLFSQSVLCI